MPLLLYFQSRLKLNGNTFYMKTQSTRTYLTWKQKMMKKMKNLGSLVLRYNLTVTSLHVPPQMVLFIFCTSFSLTTFGCFGFYANVELQKFSSNQSLGVVADKMDVLMKMNLEHLEICATESRLPQVKILLIWPH